jgi:hypothetical protein
MNVPVDLELMEDADASARLEITPLRIRAKRQTAAWPSVIFFCVALVAAAPLVGFLRFLA